MESQTIAVLVVLGLVIAFFVWRGRRGGGGGGGGGGGRSGGGDQQRR